MRIRRIAKKIVVLITAVVCTMAIANTIDLFVPSVGNPQFVSSAYRSTQVALALVNTGLPYASGDYIGATFNDGWKSAFTITGPANNLVFGEISIPIPPPQIASSGGGSYSCVPDRVQLMGHWRYAGNEVDGEFYPTAADFIVDGFETIPGTCT